MKKLLISIIYFFLLTSCQNKESQISFKEYYFKLKDFKEPLIYKYENSIDSLKTQYWEFTSDINSQELISRTYNNNFEQIEFFKEKYEKEGSKLLIYEPINNGKTTSTNPKDIDVYKWDSREPYRYSVTYLDAKYGKIKFEKKRTFISEQTIQIMSKTHKSLKFRGDYKYIFNDLDQVYKYYQYSYYVKDYGFVKYERYFPDREKSEIELRKIYNELDWNELRKKEN